MASTFVAPATLADLLPSSKARTALLVLAGALLTAVAAQVSFHVPWTPEHVLVALSSEFPN